MTDRDVFYISVIFTQNSGSFKVQYRVSVDVFRVL